MELEVQSGCEECRKLGGERWTVAAEAQGVERKRDEDCDDGPEGNCHGENCAGSGEIELQGSVYAAIIYARNSYQKLPGFILRILLVVFTLVVHNGSRIWDRGAVLRAIVVRRIIVVGLFGIQVHARRI